MTSTPCSGSPLWTSDDAADRRKAVPLCAGCPMLKACAVEAFNRPPTHGVFAGVDYSRDSVTIDAEEAEAVKSCRQCGKELVKRPRETPAETVSRKYCSIQCSNAYVGAEKRAERVAEIEHLLSQGDGPDQIALRLERSHTSLTRSMYRAGRPDLAALFSAGAARAKRTLCRCGRQKAQGATVCLACHRATLGGNTTLARAS